MKVSTVNYTLRSQSSLSYNTRRTNFKGGKNEILSEGIEGMKEFVSEVLPSYRASRAMNKLANNDPKGAIKQTIGWADNLICQPLKQAAATAVAAKGAAIGTLICPGVGTTIGAAVGYIGTLYGWAKARNKIVDKGLDIEE